LCASNFKTKLSFILGQVATQELLAPSKTDVPGHFLDKEFLKEVSFISFWLHRIRFKIHLWIDGSSYAHFIFVAARTCKEK
jgi:hypothetical protein